MTTLQKLLVATSVFLLSCSSTSVRQVEPDSPDPVAAISLEVYANGRDADQPPGSRIAEGETVMWTYLVVNSGTVELIEISVVDDVWGAIACSNTALNPGEQLLCALEAVPEAGLFSSVGTASAISNDGEAVTASDPNYILVDAVGMLEPGAVEPAVCSSHLVAANPTQDTITVVELASRQTTSLPVGDEPIDVVVDSGCTVAVSLNHRGASVSVVDLSADSSTELPVRPGRNRLDLSPDGRWLLVWADPAREGLGCVGDVCPMGEISVVDLETRAVADFATGLSPFAVAFTADSGQLVLSADTHLAVVELAPGAVALERVRVGSGATGETVVAGLYAWVLDREADPVGIVELSNLQVTPTLFGLEPTDLTLSPDGLEMMVLCANADEIVVSGVSDPFSSPTIVSVPIEPTMQLRLADSGSSGVLFVGDGSSADVVAWQRTPQSVHPWSLVKPVRDVLLTPDGAAALVVHTLADVAGEDDFFTDRHVVSVLDLNDPELSPNAITLAEQPSSWAISPGGDFGVVAAGGSSEIIIVDFDSALADIITVPAAARFAGFLPNTGPAADDLVWVSHAHGMSWISPTTGTVETTAL